MSRPPRGRSHRVPPASPGGGRPAAHSGQAPAGEVLAGVHPVREALRARRRTLRRVLLRGGERAARPELADVIGRAREAGVAVEELSPAEFDRRVPGRTVHQGVLLEAGPLPPTTLEALVDPPGDAWLVALDGIEDPQNLGAVLRVAEAAGVRGALLPDRRAAPLTAAVARASAGALEHLPVVSVPNLTRALSYAKKREFWVHAADPAGDLDLYDLPERLLGGRLVLVLGAEGRGIRPGVRASVDLRVRIPMAGAVGSLNVASAAAVVLFEWARRRRRRGGSPGGEHP